MRIFKFAALSLLLFSLASGSVHAGERIETELVRLKTNDGIRLDGVLRQPQAAKDKTGIVMIHGYSGNFYSGIMAFLPEQEKLELVKKIPYPHFNKRTIIDADQYLKVLQKVALNGYAFDHAEEIEGMHCISAPIFNRHGYPVAAIWITGPSSRIKEENFAAMGNIIKDHAEQISRSLGYGISINNHKC